MAFRNTLLRAAATSALFCTATFAQAASFTLDDPSGQFTTESGTTGSPEFSASFENVPSPVGTFNDVFNFTAGNDGFISIGAVATFPSSAGVTLSKLSVNAGGSTYEYDITDNQVAISGLKVMAGQLNSFTFFGTQGGTAGNYAGNLGFSIAAIPEPQTWAMMAIGLGMLGFSLRRRRTPALQVAFARG